MAQRVMFYSQNTSTAAAAIAFDVAGAGGNSTGTTITAAHTVTSSITKSVVVAIVAWNQSGAPAATISGCTHNGNTMTQMWNHRETALNSYGSAGFVIATGTGDGASHNVVCTFGFTASSGASLLTTSWSGVNQSTPARTAATPFDFDSTNNSPAVQITVSNAVSGDMVIDGLSLGSATSSTSSKTSRATDVNYLGTNASNQHSSAAATGSTVMGYTIRAAETIGTLNAAALQP